VRYLSLTAILLIAGAQPAAAYTCTISPKGDTVIVKTDNPDAQSATCTITCRFAVPGGTETVTCTQKIPGGAEGWYVCLRPTGGKAYGQLEGGSESCAKPQPRQ
jgi:hypothetical protein